MTKRKGRMAGTLFRSQNVSVADSLTKTKGESFDALEIEEASNFDEFGKAKRWARFGLIGSGIVLLLNLFGGISASPGPLFLVPLLLGGISCLISSFYGRVREPDLRLRSGTATLCCSQVLAARRL